MTYVAFLRGINVGGHKTLKMGEVRAVLESMGLRNVRTVLASGNVVFDLPEGPEEPSALVARIEVELGRAFGYPIAVVLRTMADLERLVASDPFKSVDVTPDTRLYVTFLSQPVKKGTRFSPERGKTEREAAPRLIQVKRGEVLSAITLSPGWGTPELMSFLEKEFGAGLTTRNWNTVTKIVGH
jgi:uncharacterized protein (DUF1697 family)